ncbi:cation:proton antiporter [Patescibacteria group bacterium]|nr:cation:proton antiporter [Patescibacteria group bacterium]
MSEIFVQLSVILGVALILSIIMKLLKQPLLIGYIITGIVVGPTALGLVQSGESMAAFSHIGVALLLFIVGLGLQPKLIREVGKVAVITGVSQILFTTVGGYFIARLLGYAPMVACYLGFAFTLSSTIIILKLLYSKEAQDTLYGRISIGFMLVQDIAVLFLFLFLTASTDIGSGNFVASMGMLFGKLLIIFGLLYVLMKFITPKVDKFFAGNKELLFIFSLGVCFVIATIFYKLHFSFEFGALVAGVTLSLSPYQREISMRLQSLRDFFLIIFFIMLGANVNLADISSSIWMVLIFSLFVVVGNPIILVVIMKALRYTTKTSFFVGLTVAQISEFSLILIGMGIGLGQLPASILGPATMVGIITIAVSTYYISYNEQIYKHFKKPLSKIFKDNKNYKVEVNQIDDKIEIIVFGCHRLGGGLIKILRKMKKEFLVIDHDPEVIEVLAEKGINCVFGSADDSELLDSLPLRNCKLIISTIPEMELNHALISFAKKKNKKINIIAVANHAADAEKLYGLGAAYVIMPSYLGRRFMVELLQKNTLDFKKYYRERKHHLYELKNLNVDKPI